VLSSNPSAAIKKKERGLLISQFWRLEGMAQCLLSSVEELLHTAPYVIMVGACSKGRNHRAKQEERQREKGTEVSGQLH
jgi:hypothetical protein